MPSGGPGDSIYIDLHRGLRLFSDRADRLLLQIARLGGPIDAIEHTYSVLHVDALHGIRDPRAIAALEEDLRLLRDSLWSDGRSRGWELPDDPDQVTLANAE